MFSFSSHSPFFTVFITDEKLDIKLCWTEPAILYMDFLFFCFISLDIIFVFLPVKLLQLFHYLSSIVQLLFVTGHTISIDSFYRETRYDFTM